MLAPKLSPFTRLLPRLTTASPRISQPAAFKIAETSCRALSVVISMPYTPASVATIAASTATPPATSAAAQGFNATASAFAPA